MKNKVFRKAFNAGKVSKGFKWRNDVEKHAYACEELKNFYVDILGGIKRRQGTKLLNVFDDFYDYVRLVPFEYRRDYGRILAFKKAKFTDYERFSTSFFQLPWSWSICFDIDDELKPPEDEPVKVLEVGVLKVYLKHDRSIIIYGVDGYDELTIGGTRNKVVFTFEREQSSNPDDEFSAPSNGVFKVYRSTPYLADAECNNVPCKFMAGNIKLTKITKEKGVWGDVRIFNIAIDTAYSFFSVADYFNGEADVLQKDFDIGISGRAFNNGTDFSGIFDVELGENGATAKYEDYFQYDVEDYEGKPFPNGDERFDIIDKGISFDNICLPRGANIKFNINTTIEEHTHETTIGDVRLFKSPSAPDDSIEDLHWIRHYVYSSTNPDLVIPPTKATEELGVSPEYDFRSNDIERWDNNAVEGFAMSFSVYNNVTAGEVKAYFGLKANAYASIENIFNGLAIKWGNTDGLKMDVFDVNGELLGDSIETTLSADSINKFQYKQAGGYMYFAHSSFKPQRLNVGDETFAFEDAAYFEPTLTDKVANLTFNVSGEGNNADISLKGDLATITANTDMFSLNSLGQQFKIEYSDKFEKTYVWRVRQGLDAILNGNKFETKPFTAQGEIEVAPQGGAWGGTLKLMESTDNGKTWNEIGRTTSINGSDNTSFIREVYDTSSIFKLSINDLSEPVNDDVKKWSPNDLGLKFNLKTNATASVWVEVVGYVGKRTVKVQLLNPCAKSFTSTAVYNSCWSKDFEFPRAVDIHEERLMFAGNKNQPSTVWLSETNNWHNFRSISKLDTDPLAYTLATDDGEPIAWLVSKSDIMIGTGNSEWSLGSRDAGQALTADIVSAKNQSADGVEYIQPAQCENMVVYARRGGIELSSIAYDFANDSYASTSLSTMNPELLGNGIIQVFNQLAPKNRIWAIDKKGGCFVFDFDKANNVAAWSEMTFGDGVVSGCVCSTGSFKSVFLAVNRNGRLCLERLDANEENEKFKKFKQFVDCVPINEDVSVPTEVQTSVKYESVVKTMPATIDGSTRLLGIRLFMLNSFGGKFRLSGYNINGDIQEDNWQIIAPKEREFEQGLKQGREYRFSGKSEGGYYEEVAVEVATDENAPFELTAIGVLTS